MAETAKLRSDAAKAKQGTPGLAEPSQTDIAIAAIKKNEEAKTAAMRSAAIQSDNSLKPQTASEPETVVAVRPKSNSERLKSNQIVSNDQLRDVARAFRQK